MKLNIYIYIYIKVEKKILQCKGREIFFYSEKLEKENEENKFYKFIWS